MSAMVGAPPLPPPGRETGPHLTDPLFSNKYTLPESTSTISGYGPESKFATALNPSVRLALFQYKLPSAR